MAILVRMTSAKPHGLGSRGLGLRSLGFRVWGSGLRVMESRTRNHELVSLGH